MVGGVVLLLHLYKLYRSFRRTRGISPPQLQARFLSFQTNMFFLVFGPLFLIALVGHLGHGYLHPYVHQWFGLPPLH